MKYISTRGNYDKVESAEAIRKGMVPAGGLFVPENIPFFSPAEIIAMKELTYQQIAVKVLSLFLTDYSSSELAKSIMKAYNQPNFDSDKITPLKRLTANLQVLELWHGPTAAFKDLALQLMPQLLVKAVNKIKLNREIVILVATSGDTGKAALEGFKGLDGIKIIVFYPDDGVSKLQETQMLTTRGENTAVVAVKGNFDDCQNRVKDIFGDLQFNKLIEDNGYQFSSANSINWGRLVPQIVYYFAAYADLHKQGKIVSGEKVNFTVPTGNFGNILAGYYAYLMGLPVNKFICASNKNNVLTDFINTGIYNINREFNKTISPSMDILISSNLERLLFEITNHQADQVNEWYSNLKKQGSFQLSADYQAKINEMFAGEFASEIETEMTIQDTYQRFGYLLDPHTAVGLKAYYKYRAQTGDQTLTIIDSTANPYKFSKSVLESIIGKSVKKDEFKILRELKELTGQEIHRALQNLENEKINHNRRCKDTEIRSEIKDILGLN